MGAAVKGFMLAVIGVYRFHGFLRFLQARKFLFQLLNRLRVVCADTAHAGTADFIKKPLYVPVSYTHLDVYKRQDHSDIKAMTAEIQKIGVNINQIAKRVNATGSVYQEDIEEIKAVSYTHLDVYKRQTVGCGIKQ